MKKTTYKVTLPNGKIATRTSGRAYTHVVVVEDTDASWAAHAKFLGEELTRWTNLANTPTYDVAYAKRQVASKQAELIAGPTGPGVISYHGSKELAMKAANSLQSSRGFNLHKITILPVDA